MFRLIILTITLVLLSGCAKFNEQSNVEQNIWNDDYYEETIVTTESNTSEVVTITAMKQQTINMKELDILTKERIDKELERRKEEDINFLSNAEKVHKVTKEVAKTIGVVVEAVLPFVVYFIDY